MPFFQICVMRETPDGLIPRYSGVDSGGDGGATAPSEFGDSEKGRSLISAYQNLAITASTPGFEKLSTALLIR